MATQLALAAPSTATAGVAFTLTVTAQDSTGHTASGYSGTVTLSSSAGADIAPTSVLLTNGTGMVSVTLTAAGSQTLTAATSGLTSALATVSVAPGPLAEYLVSTLSGGPSIMAGTFFVVQVQAADQFGNAISNYSGPPTVNASLNPASTSSFPLTVTMAGSGLGLALAKVKTAGTYTITAAAGTYSGTSSSFTVTPAAPTKLAFASPPTSTPTGVTLVPVTVDILDAFGNLVTSDSTDAVTLGIASGPGAPGFTAGSTTTVMAHNGVATFSNLTLVTPGSYTLSEVVPTLYTGPNSSAFQVIPLQVVPGSFAPSSSGFALQFNAPFLVNSMTPVLYGAGFGTSAPVPSVTLTQTGDAGGNPVHNLISGSLVLNPGAAGTTSSLTFVATNTSLLVDNGSPILPDGTYTAVIRSSAATDGFQALNPGGGFLDGLSSGTPGSGDYTTTFTVNAAANHDDVVWVPATADGPGQPLEAPGNNQAGGGYPIYLDSTGNVTKAFLTVTYDPTLLNVTAVSGAGFNALAGSFAGHLVLEYTGPALPAGTQTPIGFLTATVPAGTTSSPMPYRAKDLIHLSAVSLNFGAVPVTTSDALHLVAYVGDADGNGAYSSNDAVLITRTAIQVDSGFAAYPLVDPVIVADTDGSGFIPANAALQVNEAGVGFPTGNLPSPPIPSGTVFQPIANNVDPTLSIPAHLEIGADGVVSVPVNIDEPDPAGSTGLIEGHLALTYDPREFNVSAADVQLGSLLKTASGWSIVSTINHETGQIGIALSSDTPIRGSVGGSLVTIGFHVVGRIANPSSITLVASTSPNGQRVTTELEDAQGTFTLTFDGTSASYLSAVGMPKPALDRASENSSAVHRPEPSDAAAGEAISLTLTASVSEPANEETADANGANPAAFHISSIATQVVTVPAFDFAISANASSAGSPSATVPGTRPSTASEPATWQCLTDDLFLRLADTLPAEPSPVLIAADASVLDQIFAGITGEEGHSPPE
jgi:hypothetical protein